jgi:hypothetical protein
LVDFGGVAPAIAAAVLMSNVAVLIRFSKNPCRHDFITQCRKIDVEVSIMDLRRDPKRWEEYL